MELKLVNLSERHAKEISTWEYEGKYAMYNLPSWDDMVKENYSLCDEVKRDRFIAYIDEKDNLIGFVNLLDEGDSIFFGIGVNPKYLSLGIGKKITNSALEEVKLRYGNKPVVLEVRTWNKRAVNCYKSQGFNIIETKTQETFLGLGEFYVMKYSS